MVLDRESAALKAEASMTNTPSACQAWTRGIFGAPAVGDVDGDGRADAEDGWKSEPVSSRHTDRNPPRGVPVAYYGGSKDDGHRAVSLGGGKIRTTDGAGMGVVATRDLDWPEKTWGLEYQGWSDTIDGLPIPESPENGVDMTSTVFGIDVSHYQLDNGFDLASVKKQGFDFVIFKCTQGTGWVDDTYAKGLAQAEKLGLLVGVYHFLEHGNATAQAENLARHIVDKSVPVYIDVEPSGNSKPTDADWVAFRNACTKLGLVVKGKYLSENYWVEIGKPSIKGPLVLWRPAYPTMNHDYGSKLYPGNNHARWNAFGGQTPTFWQFTSSGKVDGYSGGVDMNAFRGTLADLKALNLFKDYSAADVPAKPPVVEKPKPTPKPSKKPVAVIAQEVLDGKWGNGPARVRKLKAAGYNPVQIQAAVNKLLAAPKKKSITTIAKEVIDGKWGNGATRTRKLKAAGYDPIAVQKEVNRIFR